MTSHARSPLLPVHETGQPYDIEHRNRRADACTAGSQFALSPCEYGGPYHRLYVLSTELTSANKEDRLQLLLTSQSGGLNLQAPRPSRPSRQAFRRVMQCDLCRRLPGDSDGQVANLVLDFRRSKGSSARRLFDGGVARRFCLRTGTTWRVNLDVLQLGMTDEPALLRSQSRLHGATC